VEVGLVCTSTCPHQCFHTLHTADPYRCWTHPIVGFSSRDHHLLYYYFQTSVGAFRFLHGVSPNSCALQVATYCFIQQLIHTMDKFYANIDRDLPSFERPSGFFVMALSCTGPLLHSLRSAISALRKIPVCRALAVQEFLQKNLGHLQRSRWHRALLRHPCAARQKLLIIPLLIVSHFVVAQTTHLPYPSCWPAPDKCPTTVLLMQQCPKSLYTDPSKLNLKRLCYSIT
jgi:hypothetical protein